MIGNSAGHLVTTNICSVCQLNKVFTNRHTTGSKSSSHQLISLFVFWGVLEAPLMVEWGILGTIGLSRSLDHVSGDGRWALDNSFQLLFKKKKLSQRDINWWVVNYQLTSPWSVGNSCLSGSGEYFSHAPFYCDESHMATAQIQFPFYLPYFNIYKLLFLIDMILI